MCVWSGVGNMISWFDVVCLQDLFIEGAVSYSNVNDTNFEHAFSLILEMFFFSFVVFEMIGKNICFLFAYKKRKKFGKKW